MTICKLILVFMTTMIFGASGFAKEKVTKDQTRKTANTSKCVAVIPGVGDVNFSANSAVIGEYKSIEAYTSPDKVLFVLQNGHGVTMLEAQINKIKVSTFLTKEDQDKGIRSLRLTVEKTSVYCEI